jgi:hypothetical protein
VTVAKDKPKKDEKKDKGEEQADPKVATLASHPRAARDLLRARGWGALAGFAIAAWLAWGAGLAVPEALLRGIVGGTVGMLAGWGACVVAWRAVASAQIRAANRAYEEAMRAHADAQGRSADTGRKPVAA